MKLPRNKKSIWLELQIVVPVIGVAILLALLSAGFVTYRSPKIYTAATKLQLRDLTNPVLAMGGTSSANSKKTTDYAELANDPSFKKLVLREVKRARNAGFSEFSLWAKSIEDTAMLQINVETKSPDEAKVLADAAASALISKSNEFKGDSFQSISQVIGIALKPVNAELAKLRGKLYGIQGSVYKPVSTKQKVQEGLINDQISTLVRQRAEQLKTMSPAELKRLDDRIAALRAKLYQQQLQQPRSLSAEQQIKTSALGDKISDKEGFRRNLTDYLSRAALNNLFADKQVLSVVYKAETPTAPSGPSWPRNISVAFMVGLLVGLVALSAADPFYKNQNIVE